MPKKNIAEILIEKLNLSNEKQPYHERELANDTAALERVLEKKAAADPVPSGYDSYIQWEEELNKQLDSKNKSLEKIEDQKLMIEVLEYYIANA